MEFTKENILGVFGDFRRGQLSFDNLEKEIMDLDDTPEKVIVPKFVADYLEDCKKRNIKLVSALCPFKMGYGKEIELWFDNEDNNRLFALAWINGYEVEKEPRYEVIIAGKHLIKMFHGRIDHEFAKKTELCAWAKVSYQLTESEIKAIDERYWPFAVPVND